MQRPIAIFIVLGLILTGFASIVFTDSSSGTITVVTGGKLSGSITWSGTVYVKGNVTVTSGSTLTISAGTDVFFDQSTGIFVDGGLSIQGKANDLVDLDSNRSAKKSGDWWGIMFNSTASMSIDYANINNSKRAFVFNQCASKTMAGHVNINDPSITGVVLDRCDKVAVKNCTMKKSAKPLAEAGIKIVGGKDNSAIENQIRDFTYGIAIHASGITNSFTARFKNNTIAFCQSGIYLNGTNTSQILDNTIIGCDYCILSQSNSNGNSIADNYLFWSGVSATFCAFESNFAPLNTWDRNYYNDYTGRCTDGDGLGETFYPISMSGVKDNNPRCIITNSLDAFFYARLTTAFSFSKDRSTLYMPYGIYIDTLSIDTTNRKNLTIEGKPFARTAPYLDMATFWPHGDTPFSISTNIDLTLKNMSFVDPYNAISASNGRSGSIILKNIKVIGAQDTGLDIKGFRAEIDGCTVIAPPSVTNLGIYLADHLAGGYSLPKPNIGKHALYSGVEPGLYYANMTVDLTGAIAPITMTFNHWYMFNPGKECGRVEYYNSSMGGHWDVLSPSGVDKNYQFYPTNGTKAGMRPGYTGSTPGSYVDPQWVHATFNLDKIKGSKVNLRWVTYSSSSDRNMPGWLVDDILIIAAMAPMPIINETFENMNKKGWSFNGGWQVKDLSEKPSRINNLAIYNCTAYGLQVSCMDLFVENTTLSGNGYNLYAVAGGGQSPGTLHLTDCNFENPTDDLNVAVAGLFDLIVKDCYFMKGVEELSLSNVFNAYISGSTFQGYCDICIDLSYVSHASVCDNVFNGGSVGVYTYGSDADIRNNWFYDLDMGVSAICSDLTNERALYEPYDENKNVWYSDRGPFLRNELVSPVISIPSTGTGLAYMNLTHLFGTNANRDGCQVFVLASGKEELLSSSSYNAWAFATGEYDSKACFSGNTTMTWRTDSFDISKYKTQSIRLKFVYSTADNVYGSPGWFISSISIPYKGYYEDFRGGLGNYVSNGFRPYTIKDTMVRVTGNTFENSTGGCLFESYRFRTSTNLYDVTETTNNRFLNISNEAIAFNTGNSEQRSLITINDNMFLNNYDSIALTGTHTLTAIIFDNTFEDITQTPIYIASQRTETYIVNSTINNTGTKTIFVRGTSDLLFAIYNSVITNATGTSAIIMAESTGLIHDSLVMLNHIHRCAASTEVIDIQNTGPTGSTDNLTVSYNSIYDTNARAMHYYSGKSTQMVMSGNWFANNSYGVYLDIYNAQLTFLAEYNLIEYNDNNGLTIYAHSSYVNLTNNRFYDNNGDGVFTHSDSKTYFGSVSDRCIRNANGGISVNSDDILTLDIRFMTSVNNGDDGIAISSTGEGSVELWFNNASENGGKGCYLYSTNDIVHGQMLVNQFSNNTEQGVVILNGYFILMYMDFINDNGNSGLGLYTSSYIYMINSTMLRNGMYGAYVYDTTKVTMYNTTLRSNSLDMCISLNSDVLAINCSFNQSKVSISLSSTLEVAWFLRVNVLKEGNGPIDSKIWVRNVTGAVVYTRAKTTGIYRWIICSEYKQYTWGKQVFTDHNINGTDFTKNWDVDVTMNRSRTVDLTIYYPPTSSLPGSIAFDEDTVYYIFLAENFTDASPLTYTGVDTKNLAISFAGNVASITPAKDWNGGDQIWINATDPGGLTVSRLVSVTVNPVNDPPVITGIIPRQSGAEDSLPWTLDLGPYQYDVDTPRDSLIWKVGFVNASLFTLTLQSSSNLSIAPVKDAVGGTLVRLELFDGQYTISQNVWFNLTPVNDPPSIDPPIPAQVKDEDSPAWSVNLTEHLFDIDDTVMSWDVTGWNGALVSVGLNGGLLTLTPVANAFGTCTMNVSVADQNGGKDWQIVSLEIRPVNDAPVIGELGNRTFDVGTQYLIDMSGHISDVDDPLSNISLTCDSSYATVEGLNVTFLYPSSVAFDLEKVRFEATDGSGDKGKGDLNVTLNRPATTDFEVSGVVSYGTNGPKTAFLGVDKAVVIIEQNGAEIAKLTSDATGHFKFKDMPKGNGYSLLASPPSADLALVGQRSGYFEKRIGLNGSQDSSLNVYLDGYAYNPFQNLYTVFGNVNFVGGGAASNVEMTILSSSGSEIMKTTTDQSGDYEFSNVPEGIGYTVHAQPESADLGVVGSKTGYLALTTAPFDVYNHTQKDLTLNYYEYEAGASYYIISGTVSLASPTRAALSEPVLLKLMDSEGNPVQQTLAGVDGHYEFLLVKEGRYQLSALPYEYGIVGVRSGYLNITREINVSSDLTLDITLQYNLYTPPPVDDDVDDDTDDDIVNITTPEDEESQLGSLLLLLGLLVLLILVVLIVYFVIRDRKLKQELADKQAAAQVKGTKTGAVIRKPKTGAKAPAKTPAKTPVAPVVPAAAPAAEPPEAADVVDATQAPAAVESPEMPTEIESPVTSQLPEAGQGTPDAIELEQVEQEAMAQPEQAQAEQVKPEAKKDDRLKSWEI